MRKVIGKKLLVAAVGVAAVSYGACKERVTSGNLMAPEPTAIPVGNLMAPIVVPDAGVIGPPTASDAGAGDGRDAGDAGAPKDGGVSKDGGARDGGAKDGGTAVKKTLPPLHHPPGNLMAPVDGNQ
jgi:hypothetical protein